MIFHSIRWRLQIWHSLILVLVLTGFGLAAYQVARDNQLRRIDRELAQRLMSGLRLRVPKPPPVERPEPPSGGLRRGRGIEHRMDPAFWRQQMREVIEHAGALEGSETNAFYYVMWQGDGTLVAESANTPDNVPMPEFSPGSTGETPPEAKMDEPPENFTLTRTRGQYREFSQRLPFGDRVLVGRSMAPDLAAMRRLALWLTTAGAAVLALGLAGGWWLASRAIRPIDDISATALKIAGGDLSQRINASDTDSELGRLAAVLNSTFARLEAAFAHQVRFTSDASHELRTPVSVILSQTQTALSRERAPNEYRDTIAACQRAAQRMRQLIESLLELARLDAGEAGMKRQAFDLARVTAEAVDLVRPLAAEQGVAIHCDLPSVECQGDPDRIAQVATNLLSNAIHFNRQHGEVRISARSDNGAAVLTVTDTGAGIPADDLPHIFERFYRVDKSRSRVQGRTGLGLAISKAIVAAHSGVIEVTSQPGAGTTFTVRLPARTQ